MKLRYRFSVFAKFHGDANWWQYETDDLPEAETAQLMSAPFGEFALLIEKIVRRLAAAGKSQEVHFPLESVYPTRAVVQDNGGSWIVANMPERANLSTYDFLFCGECLTTERSVSLGSRK